MTSSVVFRKIEDICLRMQNPDSGLPIKNQKYFRTAVPMSFTGLELVEWITKRLHIDETAEVLHLAGILCQFGYLFPVFETTEGVKDDNSLYRLQIPYFWPSHNGNPDNVEYAIFLSKRLMRNEEKHGLVEYEVEAYNKLRELLGHMWDFIQTQAEVQLKLFKEKKKIDKVVFDSQERAFWRVHRPPPSCSSCFEEKYGKLEKRIKRRIAKDYQQEIDRLRFALKTKPWLKSPKAVEMLVSWCEQFTEYDPFLCPTKDPGNPWVCDDPRLWELNTDSVEIPTERRVKRWGFSIQELIRDPIGRHVLETFLESEFSQENIRFWVAVQDLKYSPASQVSNKVSIIYDEFLVAGAPCQVNVDSRTLDAVCNAMLDKHLPPRYCFSQAEEHIFVLMSKDSYPRFLRSEVYKSVLTAAQQQGNKKVSWRYVPRKKRETNMPTAPSTDRLKTTTTNATQSSKSPQAVKRDENSTNTPRQLNADNVGWIQKKLSRSTDSTDVLQTVTSASQLRLSGEDRSQENSGDGNEEHLNKGEDRPWDGSK